MAINVLDLAGLKQILRWCSSLGRRQQQQHNGYEEEEAAGLPSDVPRGHFAVYVGERRRRFVVPIALLDRPEFRSLLRRAEEFGFAGAAAGGILVLPCEEVAFRSLTSLRGAGTAAGGVNPLGRGVWHGPQQPSPSLGWSASTPSRLIQASS